MPLVIGLAGRIGSGKTEARRYLSDKYGAREAIFSRILMDILDRLYLPHKREYLQKLGAFIRRELGGQVIVKAFEKDIENISSDIIVIDGIRYINEVEMLRKFRNNVLIYIHAPQEMRYERSKKRGEKGEAHITYNEFVEADGRETERNIDEIGDKADYRIENTGDLNQLYARIDDILNEILQ